MITGSRRRWPLLAGAAAVSALLGACTAAAPTRERVGAPARATPSASSSRRAPSSSSRSSVAPGGPTATLALAGDVHFAGTSALPADGDLGSAFTALASADAAVVNLETAVTTRGTPAAKQYVFRAPPAAMGALRRAGVDAVTVANNHGEDYGPVGLADTLAASRAQHLPVIGAGTDEAAAFAPWETTAHGVRIAVIGATDVLDASVADSWTAGPHHPGLASAKDTAQLVAAVRAARARGDVVVVDLHWGVELQSCPTPRQRTLARLLARAGAAAVVGSHAHVLEPTAAVDGAFVAYGLGNFHFYARGDGPTTDSGVLTLTLDRSGVVGSRWQPAAVRSGRPQLLTGEAAAARADELTTLCPGGTPTATRAAPSRTATSPVTTSSAPATSAPATRATSAPTTAASAPASASSGSAGAAP